MRNSSEGQLRLNLTVDQAAIALGVSPRTVRSLIARKELPVIRIGRRVLVSFEALAEWNRGRTTVAPS